MKKQNQFLVTLVGIFLVIATLSSEVVSAERDMTLSNTPLMSSGTIVEPKNNIQGKGLLDDFNRPNGPIGPNWTEQAGAFKVVNNAAQGGNIALATYNGVTSTILEGDVKVTDYGLQYTGLVLGYKDLMNCLFMKVQQQDGGGTFDHAAFYYGNNGNPFGPGFFRLDYPFAKAHMKVELVGSTVTMEFSNIDGGTGVQTYVATGAPVTGGDGIGICGYDVTRGSIDNFSADGQPPVGPQVEVLLNGNVFTASNTLTLDVHVTNGPNPVLADAIVWVSLPDGTIIRLLDMKGVPLSPNINVIVPILNHHITNEPLGLYDAGALLIYHPGGIVSDVKLFQIVP